MALLMVFSFVSCSSGTPSGNSIDVIKKSAKDAGYIITDEYISLGMTDVVGGFSVDINSTVYSILASGSEEAAITGCTEIDEAGYNISIRNGKLFTCYGIDDPDTIKEMLQSIINNKPIPFAATEN
jgi:hypothetical protein